MLDNTVLHSFSGVVQHGNKRGRVLGYPTVNIPLYTSTLEDGVYVFSTTIDNNFYWGMGTCRLSRSLFEGHIFDYSGDLYGRRLMICLYQKLRDNRSFSSVSLLQKQLFRDQQHARSLICDLV